MRLAMLSVLGLLVLLGSAQAVSAAELKTWTVVVSENGFFPTTLTINQGDTVSFQNRGIQAHWPASDLHPTHGIYPSFDPKAGVPAGQDWVFQFTKSGIFRMHDHLWPQFTGSITVTADPTFVDPNPEPEPLPRVPLTDSFRVGMGKAILALFPSQRTKAISRLDVQALSNTEPRLLEWTTLLGPTILLDDLLKKSGDGAVYDCHTAAHKLGRAAYVLLAEKAFTEGSSACHSGYYHGAMEVMLLDRGTGDLQGTVREICENFPTSFGVFECLHGIGHGLLATLNYDVPETIKLCQSLATPFDQSSCFGGMFMENVVTGMGIGATSDHTTQWLNQDPHFPCNAIDLADPALQRECYQMQTSWMSHLYPGDDLRVIEECRKANPNGIDPCFVSFGRDSAGASLRDPKIITAKCRLIPEDQWRGDCLRGGLGVIVDFWGDRLQNQATEFCLLQSGEEQGNCFRILAGRLPELFTESARRQQICSVFPAEYQSFCQ